MVSPLNRGELGDEPAGSLMGRQSSPPAPRHRIIDPPPAERAPGVRATGRARRVGPADTSSETEPSLPDNRSGIPSDFADTDAPTREPQFSTGGLPARDVRKEPGSAFENTPGEPTANTPPKAVEPEEPEREPYLDRDDVVDAASILGSLTGLLF